ncbi:hypothetical protein [Streptomyces sp. NBRC 110035]|uniref:hypothetical protein n=1 Tax=Streptomyces sp. NBRC 110035 TaxID=1547867 RepID=UPI0005A8E817
MGTFVLIQQAPAHIAVPTLAALASLGAGAGVRYGFVARCPLPAAPRRPQDLAFPLRPCSGPLRRDAAGTRPCAEPPCRPPEVRTPRCPGAR